MDRFKKLLLLLAIFIVLGANTNITMAEQPKNTNTNFKDKIEEKLKIQNEDIEKVLKENPLDTNEEYENMLREFEEKKSESKTINFDNMKKNISKFMFSVTIRSRKYVTVTYCFFLAIYIFMTSVFGSWDIKKKKRFFYFSIIITILFVIFLNIPVLIIYAMYSDTKTLLTIGYDGMYGFMGFMKDNSIIIAALLFVSGLIINLISTDNVPNLLKSKNLKRASIVILIAFNLILPFVEYLL